MRGVPAHPRPHGRVGVVTDPQEARSVSSGNDAGPGTTVPSARPGSVRSPRGSAVGWPTTLIVIRHGRTVLTETGRFSGRTGQDPPLSGNGRRDAEQVAAAVAGLGRPGALFPDVPPVGAVISSPMRRTRETAEEVVRRLGDSAGPGVGPGVDLEIDPDWIEAGFGVWEGLTYADLVRDHAGELDRWQGSTSYAPPGGDSLDDVAARVRVARARAVEAHPERTVVVVTHATPVRVVLQEAVDGGASALWRTRVSAGSLSIVRYWTDGGIELATANTTAHLVQETL